MQTPFYQVRQWLVWTLREGYRKRWIPTEICENDWEHSKRTTQACVAHVIWSPDRIVDKKWFPLMGFGHDWTEWKEDMPDYTPACDITPKEKQRLEAWNLVELRQILWPKYFRILDKVEEKQDWKTQDARELTYIDKALAGVWGLEYERLWYSWMDDFHPYALEKLSTSRYHTRIYEILLERDFQHVDYFTQYRLLLLLGWDYNEFRRKI